MALAVAAGPACSMKKIVVGQTADLVADLNVGLQQGVSYEVARRGIPGSLLQLDGFLQVRPDDPRLLDAAAEGYASYAFGFLEDENPDEAARLYRRARDYGLKDLRLDARFAKAWDGGDKTGALRFIEKDRVPPLFWTAYAWGSLINLTLEDPRTMFDVPVVQAMVKRLIELDSGFNHDGPLLLQAGLTAGTPAMAGGGPDKAKPFFDRVLKDWGGKFLLVDYTFAKLYAAPLGDQDAFLASLQKVLDAPDDVSPADMLANQIAKARARRLMAQKEKLF